MSSVNDTTFDPRTQSVSILMSDGTTVQVSMQDIDGTFYASHSMCISYGAQLGACLLMFFVLLLLTRESKRWSPVFVLNILSLLLGFLSRLLQILYYVSPWFEFYGYFTTDLSAVPRSSYATSVVASILPLFMTVTVNLSLILQAHTVCKGMHTTYRQCIIVLSCIVFLLAVGFRFAETVTNARAILAVDTYYDYEWLITGGLATETISIWFFSLIFTGKLVYTIIIRKRLNQPKWSPFQILAAMGGCTMAIPSIFAILQWAAPDTFPEAGSLAVISVTLLLPLSSLWASMPTTNATSSLNISQLWASNPSKNGSNSRRIGSQATSPNSLRDRKGSAVPMNALYTDTVIQHSPSKNRDSRDSTELDLEAMGVRVDQSYSIHSGKNN